MLALLWLVGSAITVLTLLVPYDVQVETGPRAAVAALALGTALFLWFASRLPDAAIHTILLAGAGMIAFCTRLGAPDVESVMFLLPVAYAFATFPARAAAPHLVTAIVLLGVVLATAPEEKTVAPWISFVMVAGVGTTTAFALASLFDVRERERIAAERDRHIAGELQRTLLPDRLPQIDGLPLAARYLPAAKEADVGGDLYDAFTTTDGRLLLCVGDVAGKGLTAAQAIGGLRSALRAYAFENPTPAQVLGRLDRFAAAAGVHAPMATMLLAIVDPATGVVEWASAGHPPPLRVSAGGEVAYLEGAPGAPLSCDEDLGAPTTHRELLADGDSLLLFSDGLIERRGESLDEGMRRLAGAAGAAGRVPLPILLDTLMPLAARPLQDDVTALVVRRAPRAAPVPAEADAGAAVGLAGLRPTTA